MPKVWTETVAAHREEVREAILESAGALVTEQGLRGLKMAQIAEATGIGRATLYKYFAGIDEILVAWHERQVSAHLGELVAARDAAGGPEARLEAVLHAYASIVHAYHGSELATLLHQGSHAAHARQHLGDVVEELLADLAETGRIRTDVLPRELAAYCVHALEAAGGLSSKAAVRRLVTVTLAGLALVH